MLRLIGILLLTAGCFVATRGDGWVFGWLFFGVFLTGAGVIFLHASRSAPHRENDAGEDAEPLIVARPGRNRLGAST